MNKENLIKNKTSIEVGLSLVILGLILANTKELWHLTFSNVIYSMLSFIVILEIVKMIEQYIIKQFIQLRLVIDTFFIFVLRETILVYTSHKYTASIEVFNIANVSVMVNEKLFYIALGIVVMGILMFFRVKAMIESPNETNCQKCVAKDNCDSAERG